MSPTTQKANFMHLGFFDGISLTVVVVAVFITIWFYKYGENK